MLSIAKTKGTENLYFTSGYAHKTEMNAGCADIIVCSQCFHWMEPASTLKEINRILKDNGIFAVIDYDWVLVSNWRIDKAYTELYYKVFQIEDSHKQIKDTFIRFNKERHLANIEGSGYFRYAREIVFSNTEKFSSKRLIDFTLSQASLQSILKADPDLIKEEVDSFVALVNAVFGDKEFDVEIPYRMRLGVK